MQMRLRAPPASTTNNWMTLWVGWGKTVDCGQRCAVGVVQKSFKLSKKKKKLFGMILEKGEAQKRAPPSGCGKCGSSPRSEEA